MKIRPIGPAASDASPAWKREMRGAKNRGWFAVTVEPGDMPHLAPWFAYTIGMFDAQRIKLLPVPTGAKRGYKGAALALLKKAQRDHDWATPDPTRVAENGPLLIRRFDAGAPHPLTYRHGETMVAWLRPTRGGWRMMIATAIGRRAAGAGPTAIADLADAANHLDALVGARFGDNWHADEAAARPAPSIDSPRHRASDPRTGRRLRDATAREVDAYEAENAARLPNSRGAVLVGNVLIDVDTGPGGSCSGAGF